MTAKKTLLDWAYHWEQRAPDRMFLTQPMGNGDASSRDWNIETGLEELERFSAYLKKLDLLNNLSLDTVLTEARRTSSYIKHLGFPKTWTFKEAVGEARRMASYLKSLDYPEKSQIALCSKNCAYWIIADLAIWMAGHVTVPIFPIMTADTVSHIIKHSEAKLLFVGKLDPVWNEMKKGVPEDLPKIAFPLAPENDYPKWDDIVMSHQELQTPTQREPEEMATIIYTSGSTGVPKGVMLSFKAMLSGVEGISKVINTTSEDRMLSYLPLAHAMERWIGECHALYRGFQIFFAEGLDTFLRDLQRARPTLFVSVPRLWMKFQMGVNKKLPPAKLEKLMQIPVVSGLIKKKVLSGLGLDKVRFAGSGSAPIPADLIKWYLDLGLELLEAYGMSENFCYSHVSKPGQIRAGYVGSPYQDVEVRIADDGEIQVKSPCNMMGYFKQEKLTREVFSADGFFYTGDRGEVDDRGRLKITGRTKEIFKTSKGKYVAPAPIENEILNHPRIEMCCVCGSGYPQPHALVMLPEDAKKLADNGERAKIEKELTAHLENVNRKLEHHEQLKFFSVVNEEWMTENGFLTPTLKITRAKLEETYRPSNDSWYKQKKPIVWNT